MLVPPAGRGCRRPLRTEETSTSDTPDDALRVVISPPLDKAGNSVRAQKAIADVSNALGGNPYAVTPR